MARLVLALFAACFLLAGTPANAQLIWPPLVCKTYFSDSTGDAPDEVIAFFRDLKARHAGKFSVAEIGLHKCDNGDLFSYAIDMPIRFDLGVCHFEEIAATALFSKERKYLGMDGPASAEWNQPSEQMLVSAQPCPRQSDARYIPTGTLPPGVFRELMAAWQRIVASKTLPIASPDAKDDDMARSLPTLMTALRKDPGAITVQSVGLASGARAGGRATFEIRVGSTIQGWLLGFDLAEDGWRLVKIGSWIV